MTRLSYLASELFPGDRRAFMAEWRVLSKEDQGQLKDWAAAEMKVVGVEITEKK